MWSWIMSLVQTRPLVADKAPPTLLVLMMDRSVSFASVKDTLSMIAGTGSTTRDGG